MRWHPPQPFDKRTRSGFLWLPMTLHGERRWLERAKWEETFTVWREWAAIRWLA